MHVQQTHLNKDVVQLWDGLDMDGINFVLDRLVPPSERGEKEQDEFSRLIAVSGPTMTRTDRYANVVVELMWGVKAYKKSVTTTTGAVLEIKWRNRSCN